MARPRKRKANPDPIAPSMVITEQLVIDSGYVVAFVVRPRSRPFDPVGGFASLAAAQLAYPDAEVLPSARDRKLREEARKS